MVDNSEILLRALAASRRVEYFSVNCETLGFATSLLEPPYVAVVVEVDTYVQNPKDPRSRAS
jgi:hypothetical protein